MSVYRFMVRAVGWCFFGAAIAVVYAAEVEGGEPTTSVLVLLLAGTIMLK